MAGPFGRIDEDDEITTRDPLGAEVPVSFRGQPALPVTGGAAVGSPTGPVVDSGGFGPSAGTDSPAPSTVTATPTAGIGPGGAAGEDTGLNLGAFIDPANRLLNLSRKLFEPSTTTPLPGGAVETPSGQQTFGAPEVLRDLQYPGNENASVSGGGPMDATSTGGAVAGIEPPPGSLDLTPAEQAYQGTPLEEVQWQSPEQQISYGGAPNVEPAGGEFSPGAAGDLGTVASNLNLPTSSVIPDDVVAMFGGDRAAVEQAFATASQGVPPEMVSQMADAGELAAFGIDSAAMLSPGDLTAISTGIGIAGLVLSGLKAAGIAEGDAAQVAGSLLGLASGGIALSQAIPALVQVGAMSGEVASALTGAAIPAMSTATAVGSIAGGVTAVAAPFIAWGMHELGQKMLPNLTPATRALNEKYYNVITNNVNDFNAVADRARANNVTDPFALNLLMNAGQRAVLDFYTAQTRVGGNSIGSLGQTASASGQVGGFDPATQGQMMAPYRQAMGNIAAIDAALGSQTPGSNQWYGIFGGQLDQGSLAGTKDWASILGPGNEGNPAIPFQGDQYGYTNNFTPEELKAAAGGLDPLDFALLQYQQSSPDWNAPAWPTK